MDRWQKSKALPSRIRFMVKDVVELRRSKWIPRREQLQVGPALSAHVLCMLGGSRRTAATGSKIRSLFVESLWDLHAQNKERLAAKCKSIMRNMLQFRPVLPLARNGKASRAESDAREYAPQT